MDPKAAAAMNSFVRSLQQLDREYIALMSRCGVRSIPLHHV